MACSSCGGYKRTAVQNTAIGASYPIAPQQNDPFGVWEITYPDGRVEEFSDRGKAFAEASRTGAAARFKPKGS